MRGAAVGVLLALLSENVRCCGLIPLFGLCGRWTMIAHHTCHGGYNRQDDGTGRFTSLGFAIGSLRKRVTDWFDWMLPEVSVR